MLNLNPATVFSLGMLLSQSTAQSLTIPPLFSNFPILPTISPSSQTTQAAPTDTPLYVSVPYTTTLTPGGLIHNVSTSTESITSTTVIETTTKTFTTLPAHGNSTATATGAGAGSSATGTGLPYTGAATMGRERRGMGSLAGLVVALMGLVVVV